MNVLENRSNSAARERAGRLVAIPETLESEAVGGTNLPEVGVARVCVQGVDVSGESGNFVPTGWPKPTLASWRRSGIL